MAGGKSPLRKGQQGEREFIQKYGGQRTYWQPENDGEKVRGDVIDVPYLGRGEIKRRKAGFKQIYEWLADNDFLAFRSDREPWLVVLRADDLKLITDELDEIKRGRLDEGNCNATRKQKNKRKMP